MTIGNSSLNTASPTAETDTVVPRRVLLVEDSSTTTDLVVLVLGQAGHQVTAASDGLSALKALAETEFDVVLTDFHLPDINGIEVVRRFKAEHNTKKVPSFIAITGDVRGLLRDPDNRNIFDRVVAKPLDIDAICDLVERPVLKQPQLRTISDARWSPVEDMPFAFFRWPVQRSDGFTPGLVGIDAVLVLEASDLTGLWSTPGTHLLPIIDASGKLGSMADLDASQLRLGDRQKVEKLIDIFQERRAELHNDFASTDDPADKLLARLFMADTPLLPQRDGRQRGLIAWNTLAPPDIIDKTLSRLNEDDLVDLTFFERLHLCTGCQSARLIVREECPSCQSPQLHAESYLHHFRCAYQGPESDFQSGDELVCPKCRRLLTHFGSDYDRPGQFAACASCAKTTSEPDVAFICADCDHRIPADAAIVRDAMAANLSDMGRAYLKNGHAAMGRGTSIFRFSDLPLDIVVALNKAASTFNKTQEIFSLGWVSHLAAFQLRESEGARQIDEARRLWFETFQQNLPETAICALGPRDVYAVLARSDSAKAQQQITGACEQANFAIRYDLENKIQIFGPEDLVK